MKPDPIYIVIDDNLNKITKLLQELVLTPRLKAIEWSKITKQTPNMKIGYPGQHLASLITGVEGARTGARGDDLTDGTEVKSCSRVDQLDTCKSCKQKVLRIEKLCPHCGSNLIKRMDDSKWLFSIKSESELELLTKRIDRVLLTIADYPKFDEGNFDEIRFQAFEIWNNTERHRHFGELMSNYYYKIFLEHIKINPKKTPAPKNFWPYSYQFYLCNPIKVFECIVLNASSNPVIKMQHYIEPTADRSLLISELMPTSLLSIDEWSTLLQRVPQEYLEPNILYSRKYRDLFYYKNDKKKLSALLPYIDENMRQCLALRDTDIIAEAKEIYSRRD